MTKGEIFNFLTAAKDGSYFFSYGPFELRTAFQPIFSFDANGILEVQAFEGLVRPTRSGENISPAQFFPLVLAQDFPMIDSRCRTLHIANIGLLRRSRAKLFVNFHPRIFVTNKAITEEVMRILAATAEAGLTPDRIVCEITERENGSADTLYRLVRELHGHGFRIAIGDYGAGESDISRIKVIKPDYVKFEAGWVKSFMENSAGSALLRVMVSQFHADDIRVIFEGLEDIWQVDLCQELGVTLMQGYALAQPELAPTTFNERFPETGGDFRPQVSEIRAERPSHGMAPLPASPARFGIARPSAFGKRGL